MASAFGIDYWGSDAWRDEALVWLDQHLTLQGIRREGEVTQPHLRGWSTLLRIPTSVGPIWLKAMGPGTAFEVELYETLAELAPEAILPPLATDTERGWLVIPDGGESLGDQLMRGATDEVTAFLSIVPSWIALQRKLAPHADRIVAAGVSDMRPAVLPARFEEALAAVEPWVRAHGQAEHRATFQRLEAHRPWMAAASAELAASPVPATLDHHDLHPWNIFAPGPGHPHPRPYDWGDSIVAHPFATMVVPLTFAKSRMKTTHDNPRLLALRDTYLAGFADLLPAEDLLPTFDLACRLTHIVRCLIWERAVRWMTDEERAEWYGAQPFGHLARLLDTPALGEHSVWSHFFR